MLELQSVSKRFVTKGAVVHALHDISFSVAEGEVLGIVGKSGAGKSTLLRLLGLHIRPDRGSIRMLDESIDQQLSQTQARRLIQQTAVVFQGFSLLYNCTVLDNVALPLKLAKVDKASRNEKAMQLLSFVGLQDKANSYPITLSGGEAQRVSIARALISDPKILFLDEPTSALDSKTMQEILDLLKKVHRSYRLTMVLVSHQIDVVRYMCDRAVLLEQGRITKIAPVNRLSNFQVDHLNELWADADD